jgi:hypothetical protein
MSGQWYLLCLLSDGCSFRGTSASVLCVVLAPASGEVLVWFALLTKPGDGLWKPCTIPHWLVHHFVRLGK